MERCFQWEELSALPSGRYAVFIFATRALAAPYGVNLLVNGNAESGPASTGGPVASIPGWTVTGGATVVTYGAPGGFPTSSDPGPPDRLNAFFAGGNTASSSLAQSVDVSANGSDIDTGQVVCDIEAWLGGYLNDDDSAVLVVNFMQDASTDLGVPSHLQPLLPTEEWSPHLSPSLGPWRCR